MKSKSFTTEIIMAFDLVWHAKKLTMLLLLLGELQSYSYANVVSLPRELYVLEGDRGTIRCQNRSVDEQTFYSYVYNAIWFRRNTDGTNTTIRTSDSVYSSGHTLNFNPILIENQGTYYCCLPDQSSCSNISVVRQSTPPSIIADRSNYTAVIGSQVTMECIIIASGMPTATFGWSKSGYEISHNTTISNASLALTLKNVTMEDNGMYICIASNVLSYQYDQIELTVIQPITQPPILDNKEHTDDINETSGESEVRVLAENIKTTCQIFQISVRVELESYIHEQYDRNVTINVTEVSCDDEKSVAICDLHFIGLSANNTLQLFINDLSNSSQGINFNIFRLRLCNQNCSGSNLTSENDDGTINHNNVNDDATQLLFVILLVMVIVFVILSVMLCSAICYLRCRKKKTIPCLSMQKVVIKHDDPAIRNSRIDHNNVIIDQPQYNTLQFNYDTDHSLQPNTSTIHGGSSLMPTSHHQSRNTPVIQSDHTPSSHDANNNFAFQMQANGYVLPDDFGKQSLNVAAARSNLTSQNQWKAADKRNKTAHKTTVIFKSNGTGIIRTGTLQALIPSPGSDESYTVTPSQTHESYFDVVKDT